MTVEMASAANLPFLLMYRHLFQDLAFQRLIRSLHAALIMRIGSLVGFFDQRFIGTFDQRSTNSQLRFLRYLMA